MQNIEDKLYNCTYCNYCNKLNKVRKHIEQQHTTHVCGYCQQNISGYMNLKRHCIDEHNGLRHAWQHQCNKCNFNTSLVSTMHFHIMHHLEHLCPFCKKPLNGYRQLQSHLEEAHRNELNSNCKFCNLQKKNSQKIVSHIQKEHTEVICPHCNTKMLGEWNFMMHIGLLSCSDLSLSCLPNKSDIYLCAMCEQKFFGQDDLEKHMGHIHNSEQLISNTTQMTVQNTASTSCVKQREKEHNPSVSEEPSPKRIKYSDNITEIEVNIESKEEIKNGTELVIEAPSKSNVEKRHGCSKCSSIKKKKLKKHINQHHQEFVCKICNKTSCGSLMFDSHLIKGHKLGIRCPICKEKRCSLFKMIHHIDLYHVDHICPICSQKSCGELQFRRHMKELHNANQLRHCPICNINSQPGVALNLHVKRMHMKCECPFCNTKFEAADIEDHMTLYVNSFY